MHSSLLLINLSLYNAHSYINFLSISGWCSWYWSHSNGVVTTIIGWSTFTSLGFDQLFDSWSCNSRNLDLVATRMIPSAPLSRGQHLLKAGEYWHYLNMFLLEWSLMLPLPSSLEDPYTKWDPCYHVVGPSHMIHIGRSPHYQVSTIGCQYDQHCYIRLIS